MEVLKNKEEVYKMKGWIVIIISLMVGFAGGLGRTLTYSYVSHTNAKSNTQQSTPINTPKVIRMKKLSRGEVRN